MEYVFCNYCGQDDGELVNEGRDLLLDRPGNVRLVRCRICGLIYQNPRPTQDELLQNYPENYLCFTKENNSQSAVENYSLRHELSRRCQRIQRYHANPGRLLDVGCATGAFLRAMRDREWQVIGVELSDHAAKYAREQFGLDIYTGTMESASFPLASFDVVTMWDVIEHVIDPRATLWEISRVLKPNGLFVASTPNPTCVEARLFGANWVGWERPRHIHLFPPALLECYLDEAGFEVLGFESFSGRLSVTLLSLEYTFRALEISENKWRPWLKAAYIWPFRLVSWPLYRLTEMLNKSTSITVFARRRELAEPI